MKNENFTKQKGITLIALIVTIIVLVILAGVTISMLLGENGIITRASEAKNQTEVASLVEEAQMVLVARKMSESDLSFKEDLEKGISGNKKIEEINELTDVYHVTRKGVTITVYEEGTIETSKVDIWDGVSISQPTIDEENNLHINTASQLKYLADFVNGTLPEGEEGNFTITETTTIYLESDLDLGARQTEGILTRGTQWTPIGESTNFIGIFDGQGYFVRNVYINQTDNFAGFFGKANNAVKNLTIKDSYIMGGNCMGGIVGLGKANIENCHNINTTVISSEGEYHTIGGIVGQGDYIKNCTNSGTIIAKGKNSNGYNNCGGIAGFVQKEATGCINTGTVIGNGSYVGGIFGGLTSGSTTTNCFNKGTVTAEGSIVGGIAGGAASSTTLKNSANSGTVIGKGHDVGGILGIMTPNSDYETNSIVEKCYNNGNVEGIGIVGGIIGLVAGDNGKGTIIQCYNKGEVAGKSTLGSIIGNQDNKTGLNTINNLYYLESLGMGAINGSDDDSNNVTSTTDELNSYEEFIEWLQNKNL